MTKLTVATFSLMLFGILPPQTNGIICHQPTTKCTSAYAFAAHQLGFAIKEKLEWGKSYRSEEFYAVVLKSVKAAGDTGAHLSQNKNGWKSRRCGRLERSLHHTLIVPKNWFFMRTPIRTSTSLQCTLEKL
jgi:hypothetical protein